MTRLILTKKNPKKLYTYTFKCLKLPISKGFDMMYS